MFIYIRPLPVLGFCLGWSSNFVGSESGQIQSVTSAEYGLQQNPILIHTGKGGGGGRVEPERRFEGQEFTKLGRKYQHD
jgi:hypothetical protein